MFALDPTERITDPAESGDGSVVVLAAVIRPIITLLLANCMVPPLKTFVGIAIEPIVRLPVDLIRL
jgi:hypothetical protein